MPSASFYDPSNIDLLKLAEDERSERARSYLDAAARYDGEWSSRNGAGFPRPLVIKKNVDNNVLINHLRTATDSTMAFAAPEFPVLQLDAESETPTETVLHDWWQGQGGNVWLHNAMLCGIQAGHVFIRMIPPQGNKPPRAVLLNPANVVAFYASDDYEEALWYSLYYGMGKEQHRLDFVKAEALATEPSNGDVATDPAPEPTGWLLVDYIKRSDNVNSWFETARADWQYVTAPIIEWQHLPRPFRFYGQDEMQGKHLNDAVNKVASDIKAILRVHASPRVAIIGASRGELKEDGAVDAVWYLPNEKASVNILEMQGDLVSSLNYLNFLSNQFYRQQRVTEIGGGPDAFKNMTNLSVKAVFMQQIAKTRTIRHQYAEGIGLISQAAMEMLNIPIDPPSVEWTDDLPESETEATQAVQSQIDMGVMSKRTASAELGLNYDEEQKQIEQEGTAIDQMAESLTQAFARIQPPQSSFDPQQNGGLNGRPPSP